MPTYEYVCDNCGCDFEKFESITAKPSKKCPQCGKMSLKRLLGTGAGVIFKGSGFYATDYRSSSYTEGKKKDSSTAEAKTESSAGEKTANTGKNSTSKNTEAAKSAASSKN